METEFELRGHDNIVSDLATVWTDDGRALLVSTDTYGSVCVWDPLTGEPVAGPVGRDEVRAELTALGLGPVELARASGGTVVPATEKTPALVVTGGRKRIRGVEPGTDSVVFQLKQPRDPRGHIGPSIYETVGVRFGDGTAGFAAVRFSGDIELWAPEGRSRWPSKRERWRGEKLTSANYHGRPAVLNTGSGGSHLAVNDRRAIRVMDVTTRRRVARLDLDEHAGAEETVPLVEAVAAVPLARGQVLAVAFDRPRETGVLICDPYQGRLVGDVFNRHGPAPGDPGTSGAILAVIAVPGPGGTVRVATGGRDRVVRVSAPLGEASAQAFTD